jgi:hypothetical protein
MPNVVLFVPNVVNAPPAPTVIVYDVAGMATDGLYAIPPAPPPPAT